MISHFIDFENTAVNFYYIYSIFSFLILFYFVIVPINILRIEWNIPLTFKKKKILEDSKINSAIEVVEDLDDYGKNIKKIRLYLFKESILALLPLVLILICRIFLTPGDIDGWELKAYLYLILLLLLLTWTLVEGQSFKTSISPWFKKNQKWYDKRRDPKYIFGILNLTSNSRKKLNELSNINIPEYLKDESEELKAIIKQSEDDDKKTELDTEAVKENISIIGSRIKTKISNSLIAGMENTKNMATIADDKISKYLNKQMNDSVEEFTGITGYDWLKRAVYYFRIFVPIMCLYIFF